MPLKPGTKLGPYEVVAPLGAGGMGEVWRAHDSRLSRDVALKVLPDSVAQDASFLARFQAEARAASALNHPNIVVVYDVGQQDGRAFMSMELLEGKSLRAVLDGGAPPLRKALQIAAQIADGLAAAHAKGIVHRDLKPENVIVTKDGVAKVLDFGLAKTSPLAASADDETVSAAAPATTPGTVLGTVLYMSPEQASGHPVDFRSDQFSFGTILHEILTGKRTWKKATPAETLTAILRADPPPLADTLAPAPVRWIVDRCLAKDPEERYGSTRDLARDVRHAADHLSEVSSMASGAPSGRRRSFAFSGALLLGAGLLLGALAAVLMRPRAAAHSSAPPTLRYLTYSGRESAPAVSPDGRLLAFVSERSRVPRIWIKQLSDGTEAALTPGPDRSPRFSPDGASILYTHREGGVESLFRVPVVGGEPRKVVNDARDGDYSPDGARIAFIRPVRLPDSREEYDLVVALANGTEGKALHRTEGALVLAPPRWSPDGRTISFPYSPNGPLGGYPWTIALVATDGTGVRIVTPPGSTGLLSPVVFADSRHVIFTRTDAGFLATTGRIVQQDLAGAETRVLLGGLAFGNGFDVVGKGSLVYQAVTNRANLREIQLPGDLYRAVSPESVWLTRGNGVDRQPCYSPDGKRIVFTSNRDGNMNIWELERATGATRRLTDDPGQDWDPSLSPDGSTLLWSSDRTGQYEIWAANRDGTNPRQVTHDGDDAENPSVLPGGKWVVYSQHGTRKDEHGTSHEGFRRVPLAGGPSELLVPATLRAPALSPDGRWAAVFRFPAKAISFIDFNARAFLPKTIESGLDPTVGMGDGRLRWLPDGKSVVFTNRDDQGRSGVYIETWDPGRDTAPTRRRLYGFDPDYFIDTLAVSPDGRSLVMSATERPTDLVLVEGIEGVDRPPGGR